MKLFVGATHLPLDQGKEFERSVADLFGCDARGPSLLVWLCVVLCIASCWCFEPGCAAVLDGAD